MADGQDPDLIRKALLAGTYTEKDLIEDEVWVLVKLSKAIESIVLDHESRLMTRLADLNIIDPSGEARQSEFEDELPTLRAFSTELRLSVIGVVRRILGLVLSRRAEHLISAGEGGGTRSRIISTLSE